MPAASPLVVLLWSAGILAGLSIVLPPLLAALGLSRYRNALDEDAAALDPGGDPLYADVYRQLTDLGLRPLGTCRETLWFFGWHWRWSMLLGVFGSRERGCFACVYRLFPTEPVRVAFTTCFDDGAHTWTANHMPELRISENDYVRWAVETADLALLLAEHEQMLKIFATNGRAPLAHDSLPVLAANLAVHTPRSVRRDRRKWMAQLWESLAWLVMFPGFVALLSLRPWVLPAGMLIVSVLIHAGRQVLRGELADEHRHRVAMAGIARYVTQSRYAEPQPQGRSQGSEAVRAGPPQRRTAGVSRLVKDATSPVKSPPAG
jgi:hypothetical protein